MSILIHTPEQLGALIRERRRQQGLRQADLAAIIDSSHVFLRDVERGKPSVQLGRVLRLLNELGLQLYLDGTGPPLASAQPPT